MGFFGDLFGGKGGIRAANQAAAAQQAANEQARGDIQKGYTSAQGRISPYAQSAGRGYDAYADSVGVNGGQGYQRAYANFQADPFRAGREDYTNLLMRRSMQQYNAGGNRISGAAMTGAGRIGAERYDQDVADYRNRLSGFGNTAIDLAKTQAGLDTGQGTALSGNSINSGNIEANRIMQGYGAQQQGMNNLMSGLGFLGGAAITGFAPGAGGASAFGNMRNLLSGGGFK